MGDGGHGDAGAHVTRGRGSVGLELGGAHEDSIEMDGHDVTMGRNVVSTQTRSPIHRALSKLH